MLVEARLESGHRRHVVVLATNGVSHALPIDSKPNGYGSSANGGELLCLALATCYCNDIFREAEKRSIAVVRVDVEAIAEFGAAGEAAMSLDYQASVSARALEADIRDLMLHTDRVAEVQNTLRRGMEVRFKAAHAIPIP